MENQSITKRCPSCQAEISSKTNKCPYCGKKLNSWFKRHPILTVIIGLFVFSSFISSLAGSKTSSSNNKEVANQETKKEEKTPEELKAEEEAKKIKQQNKINELSKTFCENRKGEYAYGVFFCSGCIDLNEIIEGLDTIHNAKSPATQENCQKISNYCLSLWNEDECQNIANQKIWLGMSRDQLVLSWGVPKDTNDTVGTWGVHSQWVYRDFDSYVYLEGKSKNDLVVTSWQD